MLRRWLLLLLRYRRSPLQMLGRRSSAGRNGNRSGWLGIRRGRSLNRSGTTATARWLMVIRRRLMLLLLLLLAWRMGTRSRVWSVALGWHRRLLLLLSAGMVVHVLRGIVVRRGSLNR